MQNFKQLFVIICCALLLTGCMTKGSIVSASPKYSPIISHSATRDDLNIGLVLRQEIADEVARYIATEGGLTYDFEFTYGLDIINTFPVFLKSFANVSVIAGIDEGKGLDYVLDPTIRYSLIGRIKTSAAPAYELTLILESPVIQNGVIKDRVYVSQTSKVDIPAFSNGDAERTEYMKQHYENQLTELYNDFRIQFREFLKKNQKLK